MTFLAGIGALIMLCLLVRLARRSLVLAGVVVVAALWWGIPAVQALGAQVHAARESVNRWQEERVDAAVCSIRGSSALDGDDGQPAGDVDPDCSSS